MFWAETLTEDHRYCSCQGAWLSMRIMNALVDRKILEVHMTPEDGARNLILSLRKGRIMPYFEELRFAAWDHVKIEVFGGEITLAGLSEDGIYRYRASNRFAPNCPFGDEEEWRPEKTLAEVEIIPNRDIKMERMGIELLDSKELKQEEKSLSDRLSKLKRRLLEVKSDIVKLQNDKKNIYEEGEELNKIMVELNAKFDVEANIMKQMKEMKVVYREVRRRRNSLKREAEGEEEKESDENMNND